MVAADDASGMDLCPVEQMLVNSRFDAGRLSASEAPQTGTPRAPPW